MTSFASRMWFFLRSVRLRIIGITALFLLLSLIDLMGVGLIGPFVTLVLGTGQSTAINQLNALLPDWLSGPQLGAWLAIGIVVAFVLKALSAVFVQWTILGFVTKYRAGQIRSLMDGYLSKPYAFFLSRNSSTLIQTILVNSKIFTDDLLLPLFRLLAELIVALVLTVFLLWIAPAIFIGLIASMLAVGAIYYFALSGRTRIAGERVTTSQEELVRGVSQGIGGIKEIRTLSVEDGFSDYVANAGRKLGANQRQFYTFSVMPKYLMEATAVSYVVALFGFQLASGEDPSWLLPIVATFAIAGIRLMPAMSQLFTSLNSINYSRFAMDQLYEDMQDSTIGASVQWQHPPKVDPEEFSAVVLSGTRFEHAGSEGQSSAAMTIGPLDLKIERGTAVGLVGPSGAGKSTLANLILGLHEPTSGDVRIEGRGGEPLPHERAMGLFAYIPQEQFLLDDTIEKNITFDWSGAPPDEARMARALDYSDLRGVIERQAFGLQTPCGERGARLSGGERQRLSIARALYHNRSVLVMDEVTSALDETTEAAIVSAFARLKALGFTLIMIAHRRSTLSICDRIVHMDSGQIVRVGTFADMADRLEAQEIAG